MRSTAMTPITPSPTSTVTDGAVRLYSKVSYSPTGCWEFTGYLDEDGYGQIHWHGKAALAHRVAYELAYGPIPSGLTIDHTCSNPRCVRHDHLDVVTRGENNRRAAERRTHCRRGHEWNEKNTYHWRGRR